MCPNFLPRLHWFRAYCGPVSERGCGAGGEDSAAVVCRLDGGLLLGLHGHVRGVSRDLLKVCGARARFRQSASRRRHGRACRPCGTCRTCRGTCSWRAGSRRRMQAQCSRELVRKLVPPVTLLARLVAITLREHPNSVFPPPPLPLLPVDRRSLMQNRMKYTL